MNAALKKIACLGCLTFVAITFQNAVSAALKQTEAMTKQTKWVVETIQSKHYLHKHMQQLDGAEMIKAFSASFDYAHMYFLRSEVDDFIFRFGDAIDEILQQGNLYAGFEIYSAYRQNVESRTDWVYQRLAQDFDFNIDESFVPDRREAEWPSTEAERTQLWERRLKYELLNELLSLAGEEQDETPSYGDSVNPDLVKDQDERFDPSKVQRLLNDSTFMAETLDAAREKIRRRYERNLNYTIKREATEIQESFINAMTQLFDPHSSFLSADTLENFNSSVQNSFVGIGALLQDEDGICTIKQILPGGPAEESGLLHDEDKILGVAQGEDGEFEDVVDMQLRYIVRKIKGKKGTVVRLLIRPGSAGDPSARKEVSIIRGEVKLTANLASAKLIEIPAADGTSTLVGLIELPSFYGNIGAGSPLTTTADDVTELLNKLKAAKARGIILDLRMNGGGLLNEAIRVAGLFIPVGPVVQVRDSAGSIIVISDRDRKHEWDGPLIVLTSRFSASASEIVAGALQYHDRALIVGNTSTHGKGTVQEVYYMKNKRPSWLLRLPQSEPLTRPVASKITIKQFYLPCGSSTQLKGVASDIALPSVNEFLPIGESDLPHAIAWDEIDKVEWFNNWQSLHISNAKDPTLKAVLAQRSLDRQQSLEEFAFLQQQIEWRRQRYDEKAISLNLKQRITRKIDVQAAIEALDDTYEALRESHYRSTEFILKIAEEQDALSKKNLLEVQESESAGRVEPVLAGEPSEPTADKEADKPDFDIYLRESARIMADWIEIESADEAIVTTNQIDARF